MSQEARLVRMLRASSRVMAVLEATRDLALPEPLLFSGAVYQTVWNALTGREPDYGIKDYDVGYFDPDTSWEAEDAVIRRVAATLPPPLDAMTEVRNQARVHLWFEGRFGEPYAPLPSTVAALERFVCPAFAVGVQLVPTGDIAVFSPFGLEDVFSLRLRPNPARAITAQAYAGVARSAAARWPEATVDPYPRPQNAPAL